MTIELVRYPSVEDYMWCKECTVGTMGKEAKTPPTQEWLEHLLLSGHSPIRELQFGFVLRDIPYYASVHLVRHHVGCTPYVQSQRNDRQNNYDRNAARQDTPVTMRWSLNAQALINVANARLCNLADPVTREIVLHMRDRVIAVCPEFKRVLVPKCEAHGGVCTEMFPCFQKEKG